MCNICHETKVCIVTGIKLQLGYLLLYAANTLFFRKQMQTFVVILNMARRRVLQHRKLTLKLKCVFICLQISTRILGVSFICRYCYLLIPVSTLSWKGLMMIHNKFMKHRMIGHRNASIFANRNLKNRRKDKYIYF